MPEEKSTAIKRFRYMAEDVVKYRDHLSDKTTTLDRQRDGIAEMVNEILLKGGLWNSTNMQEEIDKAIRAFTLEEPPCKEIEKGRDVLRDQQAKEVMPLIGGLLDAWDGLPNDVKGDPELKKLRHHLNKIDGAVEGL